MSVLSTTNISLENKVSAGAAIGCGLFFNGLVQSFYFVWVLPTFFAMDDSIVSTFIKIGLRAGVHTFLKKVTLEVSINPTH